MSKQSKFGIDITFDKQVVNELENLAHKTARKIGPKAVKKGLAVIAKKAKEDAPADQQHRIRKLVKTSAKWKPRKRTVTGRVYIEADEKPVGTWAGDDVTMSMVASFQEFGTSTMPEKSFLRRARETQRDSALFEVIWNFEKLLNQEFRLHGQKIYK